MSTLSSTGTLHCSICDAREKSVFESTPRATWDAVAAARELRFYAEGETIFQEGERVAGLYCVQRGNVSLVRSSSIGEMVLLHHAGAGELLGLPDAMGSGVHTRSAIAESDVELCFLSCEQFRQVYAADPQLALAVMQRLCTRIGLAEAKGGMG